MNSGDLSDALLERVLDAISSAGQPPHFQVEPDLPVIIDELRDWLADDRQWLSAYGRQWSSLLADVAEARRAVGENLDRYLDRSRSAWREIGLCRKELKGQNGARSFDPSVRRRLQRAVAPIAAALTDRDALGASWDDLLGSGDHADARREARRLALLIRTQGLDSKSLIRELEFIIEDDKLAVEAARGESTKAEMRGEKAGLDGAGRVALARAQLYAPGRTAESVIWLNYALAPLGPDTMRLGDALTLFKAPWLRSVLAGEIEAELPPEARDRDGRPYLAMLAGQAPDGEAEAEEEDVPHVLVRVDLGRVATAESLDLARETAELIVSLATLLGADPTIWILTGSHVTYYDGKESGASFHAPPIFEPNLEQRSALRADPMPAVVDEWVQDLSPHLPLVREDLRSAARLALWLRRSRETWEPGRLVLADRVFEQVAGWAGVVDRDRFVREHLRLSWALRRIRLEVSNCWNLVYASRSGFDRSISDGAWSEISADSELEFEEPEGGGWTINLRGVLLRIDFLLERVTPGTPVHERLRRLKRRTKDGRAAADWVDQLLGEFDTLEPRARRVRNATVHGGPVGDEMADSVIDFVEWLASEALHAAIKGMVSDRDPIDWFLYRRETFEHCHERLRRNEPLSDALFWGGSGVP